MKNKLLRFFGYRCPRCGNDIWLAGAPEKYIYRAFCYGEGNLCVTKTLTIRGGITSVFSGTSLAGRRVTRR